MNPRVSVVIVNYNYGRFLAQCIDSVLAQTYRPVEIIVVDDGSTDNSRDILEQYRDRCRLIYQENAGQAAGMNAGVAAATGEFVAMLDSDDAWMPHKLERAIPVLQRNPRAGWLRHKLQLVDASMKSLDRVAPVFRGSRLERPDRLVLIERLMTAGTSIIMRNTAVQRAFPISTPAGFGYDGDAFLLAHLYKAGEWGYSFDEVLAYYRYHNARQFVGPEHLIPMLNQQLLVAEAVRRILGTRRKSTPDFKLRLILATLKGARWWDGERLATLADGLACAASLVAKPRVCARQVAALLFAFAAPQAWIRKLMRAHAFR